MNKATVCLIFINILSAFLHGVDAQTQTPVFASLTGEELINEVVVAYKPLSVLNYGDARDIMYGKIDNENDSVRCVYSGHTLYLPHGVDPSIHLYMNGSSNGINAEHTYPRSKGANEENGNAYSDLHHLFPVRAPINSSRANFPFAEIDDDKTSSWFHLDQSQGNIPTENIDLYSETGGGRFEPREDHKGNVARAIFYFYSMYKEEALEADPNFFEIQRQTLCEWHKQDPVDLMEWERTYEIAAYQNQLPNPYVIDTTLVGRAFCGSVLTAVNKSTRSKITVYPNLVNDRVTIKSTGHNSLQVIDINGRIWTNSQFSDFLEIDFTEMNKGNYYIVVNGQTTKIVKL